MGMRRARRPEVNRSVAPGIGLACWALMHGSAVPWWPVRIVDRIEYQEISVHLAPASATNVMVQFFGPHKRFDVFEIVDICEYTSNLHLVHQNPRRADILSACRDANQFIITQGTPEQKARFAAATPFGELVRPPQKRTRANTVLRPAKKRDFRKPVDEEPNKPIQAPTQGKFIRFWKSSFVDYIAVFANLTFSSR